MIIYDKQLKLLTLSGVYGTVNDGQHWSKQIQLDPELIAGGNFWTARVAITAARWGGCGFVLSGFGYDTGGTSNGSTASGTNNQYNDSANTFTTKTSITTGRWFVCGSQINGFGYVIGGTLAAATQTRVEQFNDVSNSWIRKADISTGRYKSASFDLNGYAYVCNGQTALMSGNMVNTVERYTDSTNTWTTKNTNPTAKEGPAGMTLNGFGYSTCGNNSNFYTSDYNKIEQYNDSLDSWTTKNATTLNGDGRTLHAAWGLNGLGYTCYGHRYDNNSDSLTNEEYNDASDSFITRLSGLSARNGPQTYVLNNQGYVVHGATGSFGTLATIGNICTQYRNFSWYKVTGHFKHSYNDPLRVLIGTNISGRAISLPVQTRSVSANTSTYKIMVSNTDSALSLGQTLTSNFTESVSGWRTWEIQVGIPQYFAGVGAFIWVQKTSATNAHSDPASFSINGYGYAAGGFASSTVLSITDQYNDFTDTWSSKATLTTARRSMAGISLNGLGYAVNGMTVAASGNTNIVEQYNDNGDYWTTKARTTTAVKNSSCGFTLNGFGWVSNGTTNALEQYNDSTDVWTSKTAGGTQRTYCAPFSLNGYGYQACGGTTTEVNQYNDAADTWATKSACGTTTKDGVGGFQLNGNGYVAGGILTGTYNNETLLYNDGSDIWYQRPTCGTARQIMNYYMLNGYGYVGLGLTTGGTESTEMWKLIKNDSFPILTVTARIEDNTPPS